MVVHTFPWCFSPILPTPRHEAANIFQLAATIMGDGPPPQGWVGRELEEAKIFEVGLSQNSSFPIKDERKVYVFFIFLGFAQVFPRIWAGRELEEAKILEAGLS